MRKALIALALFLLIPSFVLSQGPHVIVGMVSYDDGSPVKNASVTIINERTNEKLYATTNEAGLYSVVLKDLPSGWEEGDVIKAIAKKGDLWGVSTIVASNENGYQWLNISLSSGSPPPPHSHEPSVVEILEPANNSTVRGIITIKGVAVTSNENETILRVEIRIDNGEWHNANGTASWTYQWNTTEVENGKHFVYVRAYDGQKYSNSSYIVLNVNNGKADAGGGVGSGGGSNYIYVIIAIIAIAVIVVVMLAIKYKK